MKKLRCADRNQIQMHVMALDDMLPGDHVARDIWAYVEKMDISRLTAKVDSIDGEPGAPAFDPRTLLALWLYATVDGVGSARRLARLVVESLPYRWLAGGDAINYHTLSDFRTAHGEDIEALLVASVALLAEEGWLDLDNLTVAHDGMRVRAAAGRGSMRRRPTLEKALAAAKEHVERLKSQQSEMVSERRGKAARERSARERVQRLEHALEVMANREEAKPERANREKREPRVSTTDPEAAMLHMANGGKDPAHNLQFTTEVTTRAITAVGVAEASSDTGLLLPSMQHHESLHGNLPSCALGDRGYFKYADIEELEGRQCRVLVPDLYPDARHTGKAGTPMIEQWRERMKTDEARQTYKLRSSTVEWSNARVRKQGLYQLTVRGRVKAKIIGLWHALTHNILRTCALRRTPMMTPA